MQDLASFQNWPLSLSLNASVIKFNLRRSLHPIRLFIEGAISLVALLLDRRAELQ